MSASFAYPKFLLHRRIEPQWFPHPDATPTLTVLEDAEEAYQQRMTKVVTSDTAKTFIGRNQHQNGTNNSGGNSRNNNNNNNNNNNERRRSSRGGGAAEDASTAADTSHVDDVSTVIQIRSQAPPANTTLLWNRERPRRG
jgi:hypothetical protein